MKLRFRVNNGVWFTPNQEFSSELSGWLYLKNLLKDTEIQSYQIEEVQPQILQEQA